MKKTVKIKDIYTIFQKYGDLNINVNTPYGYKKIQYCDITAKNSKVIKTTTETGLSIESSPDHLLKTKNGRFKKVIELHVDDIIKTINGNEKIISVEFLTGKKDLYDIEVSNVKQYYSNGIVSHNSSILESLTFCLFDKCSKTFKAENILNNRKDGFYCELTLDISGDEYVISRTARKTASGSVKVKVDFYKNTPNGTPISLIGEDRRDTDSIIRSYIGTYEDFILTSVSSQNNSANFIDKTQSERKDLLCSFRDITIFDKLYDIASSKIKESQILLKEYEKEDYESYIIEAENKLNEYKSKYTLLNADKDLTIEQKNDISEDILNTVKKLVVVDTTITDIQSLLNDKKSFESKLNSERDYCNSLSSEVLVLNNELNNLDNTLLKFSEDDIQEKYNDVIKLEKELFDINLKLDKFKVDVLHKKEKTKKLRELEYDPECNYCMNNIFVKDAILAKDELKRDKEIGIKYIESKNALELKLESLSDIKDKYKIYEKTKIDRDKLNVDILRKKSTIQTSKNGILLMETSLDNTLEKIAKYYKSEADIKNNSVIESEISILKSKINDLTYNINEMERQLRVLHTDMSFIEEKKRKSNEMILKISEIRKNNRAYEYYLKAIHRDSIPYNLISDMMPEIETGVNNILSQIVDFNVMLELDGKNINGKIVYDADRCWTFEMASGMEKFVIGLAIRTTLIDNTNLPKTNFLAIDEGWGALDADTASNLPLILEYLKNQFGFVFIISHMDHMRDFVDTLLDLKMENGFSSIKYE